MEIDEFQKLFSELIGIQRNRFHPLVWINGNPEIGENVYIGGMSEVNAKGASVTIGDNCDIASFVAINCADTHEKCIGLSQTPTCREIVLENNVFVGSHSVIKGGAYIGHHSVIAAGTVVEDTTIPPYSLVLGNPMQVKEGYYLNRASASVPHNKPTLGIEEERAAQRVIRSGWLAQGREVEEFENDFCTFLGLETGHAAAVSSGTSALYLALWALRAAGKKVAFPVYTCSSLRHAVALAGAQEILLDIEVKSPNIDLEALGKSEADLAIVPHMFGLPVDTSALQGIDFIEDCAQAMGACVNDIPVGLRGRIGIYSFNATKMITSGGQGGMAVSKEKSLIDAIRDYREFDQRRDGNTRFNFQMTDLQAAIGRIQLNKFPEFWKRRNEIFELYRNSGFPLLDVSAKKSVPARFRAVLVNEGSQRIIQALSKAGVRSIVPIEDWELLGPKEMFPNSYRMTQQTVSLPIYPSLTDSSVKKIIQLVKGAL